MSPINKNKLPLKYYLNVHSIVHTLNDTKSTEFDILFEICSDELILKGKEVTFSYIKHLLSFKIDEEELKILLNSLIKQKYIQHVETKKEKINYKLLSHPWQ